MSDNLEAKIQTGIRLQKCIAMGGDYGDAKTGAAKTAPAPRAQGRTGY